jgi:hypothetical protein
MKMEPLECVRAPGVRAGSQRFGRLLRNLARIERGGVLICGGLGVQCDALAMALARLRDQPLLRLDIEAANDEALSAEHWRPSLEQARQHSALLYVHLDEAAADTFRPRAPQVADHCAERLLADVQRAGVVVVLAGAMRYGIALEACWPRIRLPDPNRRTSPSPRPLPVAQVKSR